MARCGIFRASRIEKRGFELMIQNKKLAFAATGACPRGLAVPQVLYEVSTLISKGVRGLVR